MEIIPGPRPRGLVKFITSTDHKQIGLNYLVTSFIGFLFAGLLAEGIRTQLIVPNNNFVTENVYNQLFTMHGTHHAVRLPGPFAFAASANYLVPCMIGAPDMAFPRFNNLSYWLYLGGCLIMVCRVPHQQRRGQLRLVRLRPADRGHPLPRAGADLWIIGVGLAGSRASSPPSTSSPPSSPCGPRAWSCSGCRSSSGTSWSPVPRSCWPSRSSPPPWPCCGSTGTWAPTSTTPTAAASRSCGRTCSGSSATPRCTS